MDNYNAPLSPTALVYKVVGELMALADYLAPAQQRIVKRFCDVLLNNRAAIADATTLLPLEAALVVIQVEEHANTNYEISELHKRIEELGGEIRELRNRLNDET
jgi:glycine cleavage system regulatory protein